MRQNKKESISAQALVAELARTAPEGISLPPAQLQSFETYFQLLLQWNQRVRLIAPGDESKLVKRHVLESLALAGINRIPHSAEVLDLGSGGGLPGLPIKIFDPSLRLTLLDSRRMKALFLQQVVRDLKLAETQVVCERAENLSGDLLGRFDRVLARAVSSLQNLWQWSHPLLKSGGILLAQKGGEIQAELEELLWTFPNLKVEQIDYAREWRVDPSRFVIAITQEAK